MRLIPQIMKVHVISQFSYAQFMYYYIYGITKLIKSKRVICEYLIIINCTLISATVNEWCENDPISKKLGGSSICTMLPIGDHMWCSCGSQIFVISPRNVTVEVKIFYIVVPLFINFYF